MSSDYYFYNLGYLFWANQSKYGQTPIQNVAHEYGLDQYTNIDLPNETQGRVDSPAVRKILHAEAPAAFPNVAWYTGDNIEMAFGQGTTAVTPIEMANAYATFANGGTRYEPEVAAAVINAHNQVVERYQPRVLGHVNLPASIRDPILQGLEGVVENPAARPTVRSTHRRTSRSPRFPSRARPAPRATRPASNRTPGSLVSDQWPAPKYVVLCVIDQGGYGADAAAPVVAETFNYLVAHPVGPVVLKSQLSLASRPPQRPRNQRRRTTHASG